MRYEPLFVRGVNDSLMKYILGNDKVFSLFPILYNFS